MAGCAGPTAGRWRAGGELAQNAAMIPRTDAPTIALAAYSARSLAACARASGFRAIALDLFGDQDTLALADAWYAIGGDGLAIDADRLLAALHRLRARGVLGWVAGSGFEAHGELLQAASAVLPLIGNGAELVRRVRTPATFFAVLAELGITHPPSQTAPPAWLSGWLLKDAHACGGWHIERLAQRVGAPVRPGPGLHYQRELRGEAYSVLFLADGREACVLGIARQIVRALGRRPFVYRGGVGPVALPQSVEQAVQRAVSLLAGAFALRGLNGIDFIVDGEGGMQVLELNPRPTAAVSLFHDAVEGGLLRAHVEASAGRLVRPGACGSPVRGFETVFARQPGRVGAALGRALLDRAWVCDVPPAGRRHARGDPVCTVLAQGPSAEAVLRALDSRRCALLEALDTGVLCTIGADTLEGDAQ